MQLKGWLKEGLLLLDHRNQVPAMETVRGNDSSAELFAREMGLA